MYGRICVFVMYFVGKRLEMALEENSNKGQINYIFMVYICAC